MRPRDFMRLQLYSQQKGSKCRAHGTEEAALPNRAETPVRRRDVACYVSRREPRRSKLRLYETFSSPADVAQEILQLRRQRSRER